MLACMVTCRYTDKKPYDNITEAPSTAIINNLLRPNGGDMTDELNNEIFETSSVLSNTRKALSSFTPIGQGNSFAPLLGN